jgi:hypothetical protein
MKLFRHRPRQPVKPCEPLTGWWLAGAAMVAVQLAGLIWSSPPEPIETDWLSQKSKRLLAGSKAPGEADTGREVDAERAWDPARSETLPIQMVVARGLNLAEGQRRFGKDVAPAVHLLQEVSQQVKSLPARASQDVRRQLYLRARRAVRTLALQNPLLGFDQILFAKHAPGLFPHVADQNYGWWSRGGGGLYVLEDFKTDHPHVRCLTRDLPEGSFLGPDLSYDGRRVLFAYCRHYPGLDHEANKADKARIPEDAFYHLYEMQVDGTGRRQLTQGKYDDFDGRWLPNGEIVFLSTRRGCALQAALAFSEATRFAALPDSYSRCGGGFYRPVPVYTLHGLDNRGRNLRPLSAFESFEWSPAVALDGRILYTRWDYVDRFNGHFFSLWSANQDGTNPQLLYGNYTAKPQVVLEARPVPGSTKLVFTAAAHHSIHGGSLCLFDRAKGTEFEDPLIRLTPEVPFPEADGWPRHYYANPYPLSEEYFLVAWADVNLPWECRLTDYANPPNATGLYLYDAFGNLELLYRDPKISSMFPIPVMARPKPPTRASTVAWEGEQEGRFLIQNVYRGLEGVPPGSVKRLRLVAVPPKVQPHRNRPELGVSAEDPGKYVLGTVPVESDGSVYCRVPSGIPVFFQALDSQGLAVQTMRSLTYAMPGQTLSCLGCHEHRDEAPALDRPLLAGRREPSQLTPGPDGSWPLRFDRLVQPVLVRHCIACHAPTNPDPAAAKLDLAGTNAYLNLITFGDQDLKKAAFERDRSLVGQGTATASKLWSLLTRPEGHHDVRLEAESLERLATWLDTYAQQLGSFNEQQERDLVQLRAKLQPLCLPPPAAK